MEGRLPLGKTLRNIERCFRFFLLKTFSYNYRELINFRAPQYYFKTVNLIKKYRGKKSMKYVQGKVNFVIVILIIHMRKIKLVFYKGFDYVLEIENQYLESILWNLKGAIL